MRKIIHLIFATLFLFAGIDTSLQAQTMEEVNFGTGTNTYLSGINNRGYVCGYYDSAGATMGFIINPNGKIIRAPYTTGFTTKYMKINDHNVVLVNKTTGTTIEVYKAYYDTVTETFPNAYVAMSNNQQPGLAQPFGLNNKNDFAGWYQGGTYRFLWVNHDSIISTPQWVFDKYLTYNTMGTAINDNGIATGFYINGSNYGPFLYDVSTNTFTILNTAFHMQPYGINNNNVICGQYWQTPGYLTAFWGQVNNGIVTTHAMNSLWQNPNTQSVANGINDNNEIVGDYVHPISGNYVGFIYRPNTNEYRLPGYNFNTMTWSMKNSAIAPANANYVWTPNYYGSFDYTTVDPFANNNQPVIDSFLIAILGQAFCFHPNLDVICSDWRSFAREADVNNILSTSPTNYPVWKRNNFVKMVTNSSYGTTFNGVCYGFAYTSLMKYIDDSMLYNRFNIPLGTNLGAVHNTDTNAITAITRTYLKQYDNLYLQPFTVSHRKEMFPWSGLFRLKNVYQQADPARRDPRAVYVSFWHPTDTGWHEVLPFKIKTPKMFPFDNGTTVAKDTMYVYDSNHPGDSNQHFTINTTSLYQPNTAAKDTSYPYLGELCFNEVGIRQMLTIRHSWLKGTNYIADTVLDLSMPANHYYTITGAGGTQAIVNATTHSNSIPYLAQVYQKDSAAIRPKFYQTDTVHSVAVKSYNYNDNTMFWNITDKHHVLGITRDNALVSQSDNGTWKGRTMSYGTHDATTKQLNGYLLEHDDDPTKGVNILARNITMNNGDSILTENPSHFVYKITRFGTTSDVYDVWVYMAGSDSVRQFRLNNIPITGNTSHTIIPYSGPTGKSVIIQVDAGNNGTVDSTITVPVYTLNVQSTLLPQGYVTIYPNPASRLLNIAWKGSVPSGSNIIISDISGRTVITQLIPVTARSQAIPLNDIASGTYLIRMIDNNGNLLFSDKFMKE